MRWYKWDRVPVSCCCFFFGSRHSQLIAFDKHTPPHIHSPLQKGKPTTTPLFLKTQIYNKTTSSSPKHPTTLHHTLPTNQPTNQPPLLPSTPQKTATSPKNNNNNKNNKNKYDPPHHHPNIPPPPPLRPAQHHPPHPPQPPTSTRCRPPRLLHPIRRQEPRPHAAPLSRVPANAEEPTSRLGRAGAPLGAGGDFLFPWFRDYSGLAVGGGQGFGWAYVRDEIDGWMGRTRERGIWGAWFDRR